MSPSYEDFKMNNKYRFNDDGSIDIKRKITTQIGPFQTFYEVGEAYFPCMEGDGNHFFILTLITGLFGGHKFYTGNVMQGLLYFMTMGLLGVGYILDLIMIITGNYSYMSTNLLRDGGSKVRTYSQPIDDKKKALMCTLVAAIIGALLIKFMYWPLIVIISETLSTLELSLY